jgi:hypothetical protein
MRATYIVCWLTGAISAALTDKEGKLHKAQLTDKEADAYGARCLDGSPYAFYTSHKTAPLLAGDALDFPRDWVSGILSGVTLTACISGGVFGWGR